MPDDIVILHIQQGAFMQWLSRGIQDIATLTTSRDDAGSDQLTFHCCLPSKYATVRDNSDSLALIDEVTGISLHTTELTDEWRVRLTNLNETWLPFFFNAQWCGTAPVSPPALFTPERSTYVSDTDLTETHSETDQPLLVSESDAAVDSADKRPPKEPKRAASTRKTSGKKPKTSALSVTPNTNLFSEGG